MREPQLKPQPDTDSLNARVTPLTARIEVRLCDGSGGARASPLHPTAHVLYLPMPALAVPLGAARSPLTCDALRRSHDRERRRH